MADGLNKVMLLGHLGAAPEVRYTQGGQAVLNMRLATTESYLDKDKVRRERTDWHNVVVWGKRGEALGKILTKGSQIYVEGALRTSSYDNREGAKVYKTEVVGNNVILCGRGGSAQTQPENDGEGAVAPPQDRQGGGGYSRGQGGGGYTNRGAQRPAETRAPEATPPHDSGDYGGGGQEDGDIPF